MAHGYLGALVDELRVALECVGILVGIARRRVGARYAQRIADVDEEGVLVGTLSGGRSGPLLDEYGEGDGHVLLLPRSDETSARCVERETRFDGDNEVQHPRSFLDIQVHDTYRVHYHFY